MKSVFKYHNGRKRLVSFVGFLAITMLFTQSCYKDFPTTFPTKYEWKPLLAFPIGEVNFGLKIPHGFDTLLLEIEPVSLRPYWDYLDSIPLSGGIDFDFEEVLGQRDEIEIAWLRVNVYNGFPIEIEIQAYLKDEYGNVLDSLFIPSLIMERGKSSGGGETSVAVLTQKDIEFGEDRLDLLLEAKNIYFYGQIPSIPYFPNYTFKVQLGAVLGIISEL